MFASLNSGTTVAVLVWIAVGSISGVASAATAEVAKKCEALTAKAYPPRVPGNPAAGSAKGTAQAERSYYRNCIAHSGSIAAETDSAAPPEAPQAPRTNANGGEVVSFTSALDHSAYRPCPAAVAINGRNMCLGFPGRGYSVGAKGRRNEYKEPGTYKPCPASVAIKGKNLCLG